MLQRAAPSYRFHRPSGLAVVTIDGRDEYLGRWSSPESLSLYHQALRRWAGAAQGPTIAELCSRYRDHAMAYYRRSDGTLTHEARSVALSLLQLEQLFGAFPAESFAVANLKAVRSAMIQAGLRRKVINQRVGRIKRMFRWAASEEILPPAPALALAILPGLRYGRSTAPESPPVLPAPLPDVQAMLPFVSPIVRAMINLQLVTGMRPGELCTLRIGDIDRARSPWKYEPAFHKTAHLGQPREIWFGPRAQEILEPFLGHPLTAHVFSAAESRRWWNIKRRLDRESPMTPSQAARQAKPRPKRAPRSFFDVSAYDRSIARGCRRAGVEPWSANQLRHAAATRIEEECGLEAAAAVLGHRLIETTQVYAAGKRALARRISAERG